MDYQKFKKEFPVGSVFTIGPGGSTCFARGVELVVTDYNDNAGIVYAMKKHDGYTCGCTCNFYEDAKLITNKPGIMKKLSILLKKLVDSDTQTLIKAGYIDDKLELTEAGEQALLTILFLANKAELVTMAQADLDEAAKESK